MKKFIIAGLQRTGTTMMVRLISEHDNINCQGELFIDKFPNKTHYSYQDYIRKSLSNRSRDLVYKSNSINQYLDEIYSCPEHLFRNSEMHRNCKAIGFKLMFNQANKNPSVLKYLKKHDISSIHIVRKNILNALVSRKVNKTFSTAHTKEKIETPRVELDTERLIQSIKRLEQINKQWEYNLKENPYLKIFYEDFIREKEEGLNRITEFLGVPNCPNLQPQTTKLNPTNLEESVLNYEEVANTLRNTPYEDFL